MFIETTKDFLIKALSSVIQVVTDNRLPALTHVRLDAHAIVEIHGTNIQNNVTALVEESIVHQGGCVCLPGKSFFEIVKSLPDERVALKLKEGRLSITSGAAKFGIAVADPNNFPDTTKFPGENVVVVNKEEFFKAISKTLFCTSRDETALQLCAVLFTPGEAVSTDRHRLSIISGNFLSINENVLITRDTLGFITKIFKEDDLEFAKKDSTIYFRNRNVTYSANLMLENFPDYRQVLPTGEAAGIKVSREGFEKVVERAALVSSAGITLSFEVLEGTNGRVVVSSSADLGDSEEVFPAAIMNLPQEAKIRVKPHYLIEAMKVIPSDTVLFEFRNSVTPLVVLGEDHVQAIMPIR